MAQAYLLKLRCCRTQACRVRHVCRRIHNGLSFPQFWDRLRETCHLGRPLLGTCSRTNQRRYPQEQTTFRQNVSSTFLLVQLRYLRMQSKFPLGGTLPALHNFVHAALLAMWSKPCWKQFRRKSWKNRNGCRVTLASSKWQTIRRPGKKQSITLKNT